MFLFRKIVMVFVCHLGVLMANPIEDAPKWIVDPISSIIDSNGHCALGVGRKGFKNEALVVALAELGFRSEITVKSVFKSFYSGDNEAVVSLAKKLLGHSSDQKVSIQKRWKADNGDNYLLVCMDESGMDYKASKIKLESFVQETKADSKDILDYLFRVVIQNRLHYKNSKSKKTSTEMNPDTPQWVKRPFIEGGLAEVGVSDLAQSQNMLHAYMEAMADARNALATTISYKVKKQLKNYVQERSGVKNNRPFSVRKQVVNQKLKGSHLLKMWFDTMNNQLYVFVGIPDKKTKKEIQKMLKKRLKRDQELWKQFQSGSKDVGL
jgi:hypothetical protein